MGRVLKKESIRLSRDKVLQRLQSVDYVKFLDLDDLLTTQREYMEQELASKKAALEHEYEKRFLQLAEENSSVHTKLLDYISEFKKEYFSRLATVAERIAGVLLRSEDGMSIFVNRCKHILKDHHITPYSANNRTLKIYVSEKNHAGLIGLLELQEDVSWLCQFVESSHELVPNTARICDTYIDMVISLDSALKHLSMLMSQDFQQIISELNKKELDFLKD